MAQQQELLSSDGAENCRPLLKWAGGKTQLLGEIIPRMPQKYGKYIEPFIGGGALFFSVKPKNGIIADSNPELVNLYRSVADEVDNVIKFLHQYENTEEHFYSVRSQDTTLLSNAEVAARTLFLNRTCFNGLYRVNKSGNFNVPFGRYKNPKIIDEESLRSASILLQSTTILCGDYKEILKNHAQPGDFIFLDPPYLPISEYSDFKRYTKEQFYEEDHVELATEVSRLHQLGCHTILTNSNHPLVHELYNDFKIDVIQTRRYISSNAKKRTGQDIIVNVPPRKSFNVRSAPPALNEQTFNYPTTRFMGSKNKLLPEIWSIASQFNFETAIDLFSGSGIVGYMFKANNKRVISNDYMHMSSAFTKAMVENNNIKLELEEARTLLMPDVETDKFVQRNFQGLYFTDDENFLIDTLRTKINLIENPYKRSIAMSALIRACLKKRPRGIFTYVGYRYNDGRKDLAMSFEDQFLQATTAINDAIFDNGKNNLSKNLDAMTLKSDEPGLVYIDPPYYSPLSDNEYVRRYHFVEGLARDWSGVDIQEHTKTKKFKSYPTPFSSRKGANAAFDLLFKYHQNNILIVSYSSNSQPTLDEMVELMSKYKTHVEVVPVNHRYSFGNQNHKISDNKNKVIEYLFVGY